MNNQLPPTIKEKKELIQKAGFYFRKERITGGYWTHDRFGIQEGIDSCWKLYKKYYAKRNDENEERGKFIQSSISCDRKYPKIIKDNVFGVNLRPTNDLVRITIEYIGYGDTFKISNEEIINKIQSLLGEEIKFKTR